MKAITLRNLPPQVAKAIRDKAKKERRSLNRTVIALLEEATVTEVKPKAGLVEIHHDLDDLFGTWSKKEADEFDAFLATSRAVDPRDWE